MDTSDPNISTASLNSRCQKIKHFLLSDEVQKLFLPISSEAAVTSDVEEMKVDEAEQNLTGLPETYQLLDELELNDEEEFDMGGDN